MSRVRRVVLNDKSRSLSDAPGACLPKRAAQCVLSWSAESHRLYLGSEADASKAYTEKGAGRAHNGAVKPPDENSDGVSAAVEGRLQPRVRPPPRVDTHRCLGTGP